MSAASLNLPLFVPPTSSMDSSTTPTRLSGTTHSVFDSPGSYEHSRRQVSCVVVSEELLGAIPESGGIRYIEIPVIEMITKHIPKREIREVEKIVPRYEYEYIERVVEVPEIHYIDKTVEKQTMQDIIVTKPVKVVQDVPREIIRKIPKIETVIVEKIVEVGGETVEVPKPYTVENRIGVKRWRDESVPMVVAQTIQPVITESNEVVDVDVYEYEPQVIPVDVHVAKPVAAHLVAVGPVQEHHQVVHIPAAQFNSTLRSINMHLGADIDSLPFIREGDMIPFLSGHEMPGSMAPAPGVPVHGNPDGMTASSFSHQHHDGSYYQQNYRGQMIETLDNTYTTTDQMQNTYSTAMQNTYSTNEQHMQTGYRSLSKKSTADSLGKIQYHKAKRSMKSTHVSGSQHKRRGCQC